jgi:hypothetical protein
VLSVKKVIAGIIFSVIGPQALDMPASGLKDQRWVPTFRSLLESSCPSGAVTCGLTPRMRSCR